MPLINFLFKFAKFLTWRNDYILESKLAIIVTFYNIETNQNLDVFIKSQVSFWKCELCKKNWQVCPGGLSMLSPSIIHSRDLKMFSSSGLIFSGDYKYEWALVTHPEGDQIGHMDDINTAALKLSKVSSHAPSVPRATTPHAFTLSRPCRIKTSPRTGPAHHFKVVGGGSKQNILI